MDVFLRPTTRRFWRDLDYGIGALALGAVAHWSGALEMGFDFAALSMLLMRYAHLGASHLAEFADNVPRFRLVAGKKLAESECESAEDAVSA